MWICERTSRRAPRLALAVVALALAAGCSSGGGGGGFSDGGLAGAPAGSADATLPAQPGPGATGSPPSAEPKGGPPTILSLEPSATTLMRELPLEVVAKVEDPEGLSDLVTARIETKEGVEVAAFSPTTKVGSNELSVTLDWSTVNAAEPIDIPHTSSIERVFVARFVDRGRNEAKRSFKLEIACPIQAACAGVCTGLSEPDFCGSCGNQCARDAAQGTGHCFLGTCIGWDVCRAPTATAKTCGDLCAAAGKTCRNECTTAASALGHGGRHWATPAACANKSQSPTHFYCDVPVPAAGAAECCCH